MIKQFIIQTFLGAVFAGGIILFVSCNNSVESNDIQNLNIGNGFYENVQITDISDIKCAVQFEYFVTGQQCQVGGYSIKWDSTHGGQIDWYMMQTLTPEVKYTITDTFRFATELTTDPIISMQGYRIDDSQSYPELKAQFVLVPKPQ